MRLIMYTNCALRRLLYLALKPDRLATIQEGAEGYGIARNHLMKIAHELGRGGFVEAVRGRGGGLRLKGKASDINVGGTTADLVAPSIPLRETLGISLTSEGIATERLARN
ncbi:Rrf2 family transcriptional regulator [Aurantimonas sp. C2-6-R+9]|uniref:Rrf2 family transcriptional regulator n=1 Tax=unclassified Aurantimonas TaxID=2638230 RepID=UPI002E178359|nr:MULTISPECIES: Rrf2 family transcriptional regulator [unclassified Aurantimonas]MEC5293511.1 Rrf2 family transcriptional regulator [Aurantimonas sp. C2-3-R2]MEC5383687.1 Rrf2 family transcriptional regulator [Aurantimonas sp. C2-6-R+9]MEC5414588.1 Rrf2 family transcriptional regulator [Aurantimonas sp. C2-4-R8]